MDRIEEIRKKIGECDDIIIEQLAVRMSHIQEIISYKKATGIPILQPEQEKKQTDALAQKLGDNEFEEEIQIYHEEQPKDPGKESVRLQYFPDRFHGSRKEHDRRRTEG